MLQVADSGVCLARLEHAGVAGQLVDVEEDEIGAAEEREEDAGVGLAGLPEDSLVLFDRGSSQVLVGVAHLTQVARNDGTGVSFVEGLEYVL